MITNLSTRRNLTWYITFFDRLTCFSSKGRQKLATAIKYLTQSTWSHAALYAGNLPPMFSEQNAVSSVVLTHGYPLTCRGKQKCNRAV